MSILSAPGPAPSETDQQTYAFRAGLAAAERGSGTVDCPYGHDKPMRRVLWLRGWIHHRIRGEDKPTPDWPYERAVPAPLRLI